MVVKKYETEHGFANEHIDVTDDVEEYIKGKVVHCPCGHGIGLNYGTPTVKCAKCDSILIDSRAGSREYVDEGESQQSDLSDWC